MTTATTYQGRTVFEQPNSNSKGFREAKRIDFGTSRACEHEGCPTTLSRYNPMKFCYAHAPRRYRMPRGRAAM